MNQNQILKRKYVMHFLNLDRQMEIKFKFNCRFLLFFFLFFFLLLPSWFCSYSLFFVVFVFSSSSCPLFSLFFFPSSIISSFFSHIFIQLVTPTDRRHFLIRPKATIRNDRSMIDVDLHPKSTSKTDDHPL